MFEGPDNILVSGNGFLHLLFLSIKLLNLILETLVPLFEGRKENFKVVSKLYLRVKKQTAKTVR